MESDSLESVIITVTSDFRKQAQEQFGQCMKVLGMFEALEPIVSSKNPELMPQLNTIKKAVSDISVGLQKGIDTLCSSLD